METENSESALDSPKDEKWVSKVHRILEFIFDKRLYGSEFFVRAAPLLGLGFIVQFVIIYLLNRIMIFVYVPTFLLLILVSALASKNYTRETSSMTYARVFLFLIASVLASDLPFALGLQNTLYSAYRFLLIFTLSNAALVVAITETTIYGHRISLRRSIPLNDDFFKKEKNIWSGQLEGFPNSKNIISNLDDGFFVSGLFEKGSFSLAVLWSCNLMEKVIDSSVETILSQNPEKSRLFRKENGERRGYPQQLKNLGFNLQQTESKGSLSTERLWHELRRNIAHFNHKASFQETYDTLKILVSFTKDFPKTLQP